MAAHIPFAQSAEPENHPSLRQTCVHAPQPARARFNWWGFNGLWLSMGSFLTAGFFSPVALLVSLVGLRRRPRKMAIAGTTLSLFGIGLATLIVSLTVHHHHHRYARRQQHAHRHTLQRQHAETVAMLSHAKKEVIEFCRDCSLTPNEIELNMLVIKHVDPWGQSLRFDNDRTTNLVRSAGPDKHFESRDDLTIKIPVFDPAYKTVATK